MKEIMDSINNYFIDTVEPMTFNIVTDGVTGSFSHAYFVGQYFMIQGSKMNDGVYKITVVSTSKLTIAETLTAENVPEGVIYGLAVPRDFDSLATQIKSYSAKALDGIKSESQGSRSVSYTGDSGWSSVFSKRLNTYRRVYKDKRIITNPQI